MIADPLKDTPLAHRFCPSLESAERDALREAADTGGILLRVKSLKISTGALTVTGVIPTAALVLKQSKRAAARLQPRSIGTMHLMPNSLLHPSSSDQIGYLVLHTPVIALDPLPDCEDGEDYWGALTIRGIWHTPVPASLGATCCARCNRPIPQQRLLAVPNTRVCTNCQQKKENTCSKLPATSSH